MHPVVTTLRLFSMEVPVASYGLCVAMGMFAGAAILVWRAHRSNFDAGRVIALTGFTALGAVAGAWSLAVAIEALRTGDLRHAVEQGGFVFYGALVGGSAVFFAAARRLGLDGLELADLAVPGVAIAHAIGRVGCFLGGCCYGTSSGAPWAVTYSDALTPAALGGFARHPTQLYEAAGLLLLALVFAFRSGRGARAGHAFAAYVVSYAVLRFGLEFLRGDAVRGHFGVLSTSQWIALATVVAVLPWTLARGKRVSAAITSLLIAGLALPGVAQSHLRADLARVIHIPGGWYDRGSYDDEVEAAQALCKRHVLEAQIDLCEDEQFNPERPKQRVWVSAFGIDRTEVTSGAYDRCVDAMVCAPPDSPLRTRANADLPVTHVTKGDAETYCRFVGGRLPTEAEWERAARGHDGRIFPWGRYYNERLANHGDGDGGIDETDGYAMAAPVGSYPDAASPYGILDLAGNVWEWTADSFASYIDLGPRVDPRPPRGPMTVVRGGSWLSQPFTLRAAHREAIVPETTRPDLGFRCAHGGHASGL